jgi:hypothetical protein
MAADLLLSVMTLAPTPLSALQEGHDWTRVHSTCYAR